MSAALIRRAVRLVLCRESAPRASISVTLLPPARIRVLNRRLFKHDRVTDVIAYSLPHGADVAGDIYLCPAVARESARALGVDPLEELLRLVIHGTLHVLGYDHPESDDRMRSPMWRRQERYVRALTRSTRPK